MLKTSAWTLVRKNLHDKSLGHLLHAGGRGAIVFAPWPLINQAYQGCSQIQSLRVATR